MTAVAAEPAPLSGPVIHDGPVVFISYNQDDSRRWHNVAESLAESLSEPIRSHRNAWVYLDTRESKTSVDYFRESELLLRRHSVFMPILTQGWLNSQTCRTEYQYFLQGYGLGLTDDPTKCARVAARRLPLLRQQNDAATMLGARDIDDRATVAATNPELAEALRTWDVSEQEAFQYWHLHAIRVFLTGGMNPSWILPDRTCLRTVEKGQLSRRWNDWIDHLATDLGDKLIAEGIDPTPPPESPQARATIAPGATAATAAAKPSSSHEVGRTFEDLVVTRYRTLGGTAKLVLPRLASIQEPTGGSQGEAQTVLLDMALAALSEHSPDTVERWLIGVLAEMGITGAPTAQPNQETP